LNHVNISFCRLLCNYETYEGSFTSRDDILNHLQTEKENILTSGDLLTKCILGRAINELWCSDHTNGVTATQRSFKRVGKSLRLWGYKDLKKKTDLEMASTDQTTNSLEKEWSCFEADLMATGIGWQMKKNSKYSISCIHLTDYSFNGQRALELELCKKSYEYVRVNNKHLSNRTE